MTSNLNDQANEDKSVEYITVTIGEQLFGLPIYLVHDVFMLESMTRVPLALPEIAGVLNLRGRIVTAIDMRKRLALPPRDPTRTIMAVGIDSNGESYGLMIDRVGEVLRLSVDQMERNPANIDPTWGSVSGGIFRLDGQLLVILDVDRVLDIGTETIAA